MRRTARFPGVRTSVSAARRLVATTLTGLPDEVCEAAALVASELASNSVRHAASAFELRIEKTPEQIRIEVEDEGSGKPALQSPGPTDTSGRGLRIVEAFADEWGVIPRDQASGKTVWVTIAVPPSGRVLGHATHHATDGRGPRRRPEGGPRGGGPGSQSSRLSWGQGEERPRYSPSLSARQRDRRRRHDPLRPR